MEEPVVAEEAFAREGAAAAGRGSRRRRRGARPASGCREFRGRVGRRLRRGQERQHRRHRDERRRHQPYDSADVEPAEAQPAGAVERGLRRAQDIGETRQSLRGQAQRIVVDAAVKSATPTRVEVLLFVDQSITNAANPSPRIDRNRIDMTMDLVGGRWLASNVEIL